MPRFLDTRGKSRIAVAICDRCHLKFPWVELQPDPNYPGLRVCRKDLDVFDPWRLPARIPEDISMPWVRPDVSFVLPNPVTTATVLVTEDSHGLVTEAGENIETGEVTI